MLVLIPTLLALFMIKRLDAGDFQGPERQGRYFLQNVKHNPQADNNSYHVIYIIYVRGGKYFQRTHQ